MLVIIKWIYKGTFIKKSSYALLLEISKNKLTTIQDVIIKYFDIFHFNFSSEYKNIVENNNKPVIDIITTLITSICLTTLHIITIENVLIRILIKLNINILIDANW